MLAKRIIPCLDVKNNNVVKGVKFRDHQMVGDILKLATEYAKNGADELVFYDITASSENRTVEKFWIETVAKFLDIPFCVAGGIASIQEAEQILNAGADKISLNSPALSNPNLIGELARSLGSQCVVIGIDSVKIKGEYFACQYTGDEKRSTVTQKTTKEWIQEVQARGAGEIVLNCMDQDGVRCGYDLEQLQSMRELCNVPLIASGGAGTMQHFFDVFQQANVDGALAASVFHKGVFTVSQLKNDLAEKGIRIRR